MAKQHSEQTTRTGKLPPFLAKRLGEGGFILVLTLALFILLSLLTYHATDPGWSHISTKHAAIANAGGQVGAYLADALCSVFGQVAYLIPICIAYFAFVILNDVCLRHVMTTPVLWFRGLGLLFLWISCCGVLSLRFPLMDRGGWLGHWVASGLRYALNVEGSWLLLLAVMLVSLTGLTGISWIWVTEKIGAAVLFVMRLGIRGVLLNMQRLLDLYTKKKDSQTLSQVTRDVAPRVVPKVKKASPRLLPIKSTVAEPRESATVAPVMASLMKKEVVGSLPDLSLLDAAQPNQPMAGFLHQELETLSRDVEQHLQDFGIVADVVAVHPGPVITRFELQLAAGIKVSRLTALAKDLARSLSVMSVRVVEIIPGKTVVGIELPNPNRAMVCLTEVLSSEVYQQAHSPLTLALGVDIAGHPMVVDLAKMPHLLVAGTTGSGKSVGINAMILSLLFKATPEQVRLILIDPKMLELSVYDGIPHLLTPVVTDMKEAASALRWCVAEMERRYRVMSALGVRNIVGFNAKVSEALAMGEPLLDPLWSAKDTTEISAPMLSTLPYVVVVIDELADMMMVVGKKVEQLIARIAQKARAAGIHLILATQRPSVDVLTGLIKSNIPTRISFQVSSKIDSRTILDQQGAEQLLGHGDMLFLAPGTGAPLRVHGAFVDDLEVHRIADDWRARGEPAYIDDITQTKTDGFDAGFDEDDPATEDVDALYDQAVEFVLQTRKASVSAVQRRFKIGYNRAARLVEEMERTGLVGPMEGGFRDVFAQALPNVDE